MDKYTLDIDFSLRKASHLVSVTFGSDLCVLRENANIKCSFHRHTYVIYDDYTLLWHHLFHVVNIVIQFCFLFSGMLLQLAFVS